AGGIGTIAASIAVRVVCVATGATAESPARFAPAKLENDRAGLTLPLLRKRQERIAFSRTESAACRLAQKKEHESRNKAQADRECEWNDGHGGSGKGCAATAGRRAPGHPTKPPPPEAARPLAMAVHILTPPLAETDASKDETLPTASRARSRLIA